MRTLTLGIETSCDETAASVVLDGKHVLSNVIASQVDIFQKFGGVVPEISSRKHIEAMLPVIKEALDTAKITLKEVDLYAVTMGPGLVGGLLVGISTAKALSYAEKKPLLGVNHIEGHIYANVISHHALKPPLVCLTVSGGHTDLLFIPSFGTYKLLGRTRDDAAGEAFDKVARVLKLPYPGGPQIDELAKKGDRSAISFPLAMKEEGNHDFSFSGLKTAALNFLNRVQSKGEAWSLPDFAASFQWAIVDILTRKLLQAARYHKVKQVILSGGVAANSALREHLLREGEKVGLEVFFPPPMYCTDNAAMIASAGYYRYKAGYSSDYSLNAMPSLSLGLEVEHD